MTFLVVAIFILTHVGMAVCAPPALAALGVVFVAVRDVWRRTPATPAGPIVWLSNNSPPPAGDRCQIAKAALAATGLPQQSLASMAFGAAWLAAGGWIGW